MHPQGLMRNIVVLSLWFCLMSGLSESFGEKLTDGEFNSVLT